MFGGTRKPVASAGVSFRVNLFGIAITRVHVRQAVPAANRGWVFQFNLSPGF